MNMEFSSRNRQILIIDDNPSIHADFKKILADPNPAAQEAEKAVAHLLGTAVPLRQARRYELTFALQGNQGLAAVQTGVRGGRPFALAFVDVRMPPGWDGLETAARLWEADPDLQIVLCTAHADYSWEEMIARVGESDRLVFLKKPFDAVEVLQLASALTEKWMLLQQSRMKLQDLEQAIVERTRDLQFANEQLHSQIRERQATEQALREAQEKLRHFLAKSPAVLYSLRVESGRLVPAWVSDNVADFLGGDARDWHQQMPALDHVVEADRAAVFASLDALAERGQLSLQYRIQRRNGETIWVRDDRQLLRDPAGQPVEIVGCWTDITQQRRLEEQLRQAQKMESIGHLAGGVAHDFNNLLTVILGYTELVLNTEPLPTTAIESLREVHTAADKASHLTRQLLAFSRRQMMRRRDLNLSELVVATTQILGRMLGEHIKVRADCPAGLPGIVGDRGMIEQVILNLAINARDAMPDGGRLTLATSVLDPDEAVLRPYPESRPGRFVCLSVTDSGRGIAREHLPRLFEPFFTTKDVGQGTGLGLATVYGIVKQHEGWVEVESQLGQGTTFKVFLPVPGVDEAPGQKADGLASGSAAHETILVVEDDPSVLELISVTLQRQGYRVHSAASGGKALAEWISRVHEIDLLLTDVVMPDGLTGWELAKEFQSRRPLLKVIYMSGYNPDMTAGRPVFGKDVRFLQKPFSQKILAEIVRAYLDEAPSESSVPPGPVVENPAPSMIRDRRD